MGAINITVFGGLNVNDAPESLAGRSMQHYEGTWSHRIGVSGPVPVEASRMVNCELERQRVRQRKGSTAIVDLGAAGLNVLVAGDEILEGIEYRNPVTNARVQVLVGKKSIYTNQSGTFTQVNNNSGTPYTHADPNVTRVGLARVDGHLFIGLDGANKIQVYRNGANLDPEMSGGNLYFHTNGGASTPITGVWGDGCFLVAGVHGRLVFCDGSTTVQYTAPFAPWDLGGALAGNKAARARVLAMASHAPLFADSLSEVLYILGAGEAEVLTGFTLSDVFQGITGAPPPISHRAVISTAGWLCYMAQDGGLWGINGANVINLGRRLKAFDGTGPLDDISLASAETTADAFYDADRKQAVWLYPSAGSASNDRAVVLDLQLGEPRTGEAQSQYEERVRCLYWTGTAYATIYQAFGMVVGATSGGTLWQMHNGDSDFATVAIAADWQGPDFSAGWEINHKSWLDAFVRNSPSGNWYAALKFYVNRAPDASVAFQVHQGAGASYYGSAVYGTDVYTDGTVTRFSTDVDLYAETLRPGLSNSEIGETFILNALEVRYRVGAEER